MSQATYRKTHNDAVAMLRWLHHDWYTERVKEARARVTAEGRTEGLAQYAHSCARTALLRRFSDTHKQFMACLRDPSLPRSAEFKRGFQLLTRDRSRRDEIDPTDAEILLNRGLTVAEIAKHDNCTQAAVLRVLVPILAGRRASTTPWYERSRPATPSEVAKRLGTRDDAVARYWPQAEPVAA